MEQEGNDRIESRRWAQIRLVHLSQISAQDTSICLRILEPILPTCREHDISVRRKGLGTSHVRTFAQAHKLVQHIIYATKRSYGRPATQSHGPTTCPNGLLPTFYIRGDPADHPVKIKCDAPAAAEGGSRFGTESFDRAAVPVEISHDKDPCLDPEIALRPSSRHAW